MSTAASPKAIHKGGFFLIESTLPEEVFTPEDFTEEHHAIARTTDEFWNNEIAPNIEALQKHEPGLAVSLLRKSGELGLTGVDVPEKYGGMEMDLASMMIVGEHLGKDGSYATTHAAQVGIGTLPVLLFGTEDQKQRYLPKLASAGMVAAYCLTEAQAGSDALAARTRADLSPDGKYYVLNGQKMWITNGTWADLYTIFAKVDGEKFTAFLVERAWPGVQPGAEEQKMGIKGSSTTAVYIDNVKVPVENVLGEVGRGHIIAFNILNLGRLKLGPIAVGACKEVLRLSLKYAKERHTFGKPIAAYGMIQHKLAEMAIRTFAAETMAYRVVGLIEDLLAGFSWEQPDANRTMLKSVEEFATECSYVKLFCSEALDYVTDEGVQIHGGYGYHHDYAVERAYRDSRINRIFEGTNEINRLLATGMLLKRAQRGQLPLVAAVKKLQAEVLGGAPAAPSGGSEEGRIVANAKKIALFALGIAYQRYVNELEQQQEIIANLTDISMNVFAMESVLLRAAKLAARGKGDLARDMCSVYLHETLEAVESAARTVLAACSEGDMLRTNMSILKRFTKAEPANVIALRRSIAARLLQADRYVV